MEYNYVIFTVHSSEFGVRIHVKSLSEIAFHFNLYISLNVQYI